MSGVAASVGAFALSLSLAALCARRIRTALGIGAAQAMAAALATGVQGLGQHAVPLTVAALVGVALNGIGLPLALQALTTGSSMPSAIGQRGGSITALAAAFALSGTAVAAAMPVAGLEQPELLALGLAVLLLGLLLLLLRRHPLMPGLALLSSQNGIVLTAGAVPGLPGSAVVLAAVPVIPFLVVAGVWLHDRGARDLTAA